MNPTALNHKTQPALTFGAHEVKTIKRDGQFWLNGTEVGTMLQYASPDKAIKQIYKAHSDEFSSTMTRVISVATAGGKQAIRFFSLRGAHLLAMFARTAVAKEFRVWVLNILDRELAATKLTATPAANLNEETRRTIQSLCNEVQYMGSWWKRYGQGIEIINPHAFGQIFERFLFAPGRAEEIVQGLGLTSNRTAAASEKWEWLEKNSRQQAKMAARIAMSG